MSYFIERRKHFRLAKELTIRYKFITQNFDIKYEQFYEATAKNISATGILLKAKIPSPELLSEMILKKVLILLEIVLLKNNTTIKATAQLRWLESVDVNNNIFNIGLKFVDISQKDKNLLTEFILNNIY